MILPEDVKLPGSGDDVELDNDVDVEAGHPSPARGSMEVDECSESHPFLPSSHGSNPNPPPYTRYSLFCVDGTPGHENEKPRSIRQRLANKLNKTRSIFSIPARIVIGLFVLYFLLSPFSFPHWHRHHHHGVRPSRDDGSPVHCVQLFQEGPEGSRSNSGNATFAIPLTADDIFASLRAESVAEVTVSTYDPDTTNTTGITYENEPDGPQVLVTVQASYDGEMVPDVPRVCLMANNETRGRHGRRSRSLGVGVYSQDEGNYDALKLRVHIALPLNETAPELDYRWYKRSSDGTVVKRDSMVKRDSIVGAVKRSFVVRAIMDALAPTRPAKLLPPLRIQSVTDVTIEDLSHTALSKLEIDTVGDISLAHVRAEVVHLKSVGNITANVAVSNSLDVESPTGTVDVTISSIRSPAYKFFKYHGPPLRHNSTDAECALPPVSVRVRGSGNVVRHDQWEVPCRGISESISSVVGDVDVYPHPLFEGPVSLTTTVGTIGVQRPEVSDPLRMGRHRIVNLKSTEVRSQLKGFVRWASKSESSQDMENSFRPAGKISRRGGPEEHGRHGPPPHGPSPHGPPPHHGSPGRHGRPAPRKPGLVVTTSVGTIRAIF